MKKILISIPLLFFYLAGAACAGPLPVEEITLARAAMSAAEGVEAARLAPGYWHKAETNFREANKLLEGNYNKDARVKFDSARRFAEKAENASRLKKFKSGEGAP